MPKVNKKQAELATRPVLYPTLEIKILEGADALTVSQAAELMGLEQEQFQTDSEPGTKFGDDFLFRSPAGTKVRCVNNMHNRPFDAGWMERLAQDILNRHWADSRNGEGRTLNGETIILGKTGSVLSGQHRLAALWVAGQLWKDSPQSIHWHTKWPTEPTIEAIVVQGVDESPYTTRTLDNVKPRSLADVLFCDGEVFGKADVKNRGPLCRILDNAVKLLWDRTGAKADAFSPNRTHSEAIEFIGRHSRIIRCVKHIFEENKDSQLSKNLMSPGYAAALMYLMGCCKSDGDEYRNMDAPGEKKLDWEYWDRASEFWVELGAGDSLKAIRTYIGELANKETSNPATLGERTAVIVKAWAAYKDGGDVNKADIKLRYQTDPEDNTQHLIDFPTIGGIDLGDNRAQKEAAAAEGAEEGERSEEEIKTAARKERARALAEKMAADRAKAKADKKAGKSPTPAANGEPRKLAPVTRKQVEAEQTRKAREADEAIAKV